MQKKSLASKVVFLGVFFVILTLLFFLCISIGTVNIPFTKVLKTFFTGDFSGAAGKIIMEIRLPRIIAALFCGGALSVSGVILQKVFANPIASPSTIGVNAGSGLFTLIAFALFPYSTIMPPIFAFVGALISGLLVFFIGWKTGASKLTIVLSGVAITALFAAFTDVLILLNDNLLSVNQDFRLGGLSGVTFSTLILPMILIVCAVLASELIAGDLNVLALGHEQAKALGVRVLLVRFISIVIAAILAGAAVSVVGLVGFVGLIVPHIARLVFKDNTRVLIPISFVFGGALLMVCDLIARVIAAPYELPVGIILAIIGAPFFLALLIKNRRRTFRNDRN